VSLGNDIEREIWLWDFGGQADQRLIHQLYMDETALAVLVFDGQKEDLFETLGQWDRDLTRASRKNFSKLLVAGRVDAGGLRVSRTQIEAFMNEHGYLQLLETSAKSNLGCEELKKAIQEGIRWDDIPWRSSFGSWVLLQPERINAYAQAVIQTMREDEHERGCLSEERVLNGYLTYHSSMARLQADEERFVLLAMHQMLVPRPRSSFRACPWSVPSARNKMEIASGPQSPGELMDEHLKKNFELSTPRRRIPAARRVGHFQTPEVHSDTA
jgi:hypothetical protein